MQVLDGPSVQPGLTDSIAFSVDGINWDFVNKSQISTVTGFFAAAGSFVEPNYPHTNKTILRIERSDDHAPITFELQDVTNQATWSTGLITGLEQAKEDIAGFYKITV